MIKMTESDKDVLIRNHQFVRNDEDDRQNITNWEIRMTRRYYDQLFKEYALADLTRYKEGQVGMRWRTQTEVIEGKGQQICGNILCSQRHELHSYEVPFQYIEETKVKLELVKVRLCPKCTQKIFYKHLSNLQSNINNEGERGSNITKEGERDSESERFVRKKTKR